MEWYIKSRAAVQFQFIIVFPIQHFNFLQNKVSPLICCLYTDTCTIFGFNRVLKKLLKTGSKWHRASEVEFEPFFTKLGNSLSSNLGKSNLLKESNLFPESQSRSDLFQLGVTVGDWIWNSSLFVSSRNQKLWGFIFLGDF